MSVQKQSLLGWQNVDVTGQCKLWEKSGTKIASSPQNSTLCSCGEGVFIGTGSGLGFDILWFRQSVGKTVVSIDMIYSHYEFISLLLADEFCKMSLLVCFLQSLMLLI